jgi:hypothetical protein
VPDSTGVRGGLINHRKLQIRATAEFESQVGYHAPIVEWHITAGLHPAKRGSIPRRRTKDGPGYPKIVASGERSSGGWYLTALAILVGMKNPRWIFGFALLLLIALLAGVIALGKVEQQTSFGLQEVLGALSVLAGGFSQWAFSNGTKSDDDKEK